MSEKEKNTNKLLSTIFSLSEKIRHRKYGLSSYEVELLKENMKKKK